MKTKNEQQPAGTAISRKRAAPGKVIDFLDYAAAKKSTRVPPESDAPEPDPTAA